MLAAGQPAPDIALPAGAGFESLSELVAADGRPVLVYFYPADFSPLCTAQACMVSRRLARAGEPVPAVGVSPQGGRTHAAFAGFFGLDAVLVSDPDRAIARAWGVAGPVGTVRRATFIVGPGMRIVDAVVADFRLAPHRRVVRRLLELRAGS